MAKQISSLSVALFATVEPLVAGFKRGEGAATSLVDTLGHVGGSLLAITGAVAAAAGSLAALFDVGKGFDLAAQYETAAVQLGALSGSAEQAGTLLTQLRDFAATSPFGFPELDEAAKRLLSVGVTAAGIPGLLKQIGDVAAGTGAPLGEIADQFARAAAEGHVGSRELLALSHQGVPILQVLAGQFHTTADGVAKLAEAGRIGFGDLVTAFATLTGPAGKFGGIIAAQSHTLGGALHNLSATVDENLADIAGTLDATFDLSGVAAKLSAGVSKVGGAIMAGLDVAGPRVADFAYGVADTFGGMYDRVVPVFEAVGRGVLAAWGVVSTFVADQSATVGTALTYVGGALAGLGLPAVFSAIGAAAGLAAGLLAPLAGVLLAPLSVAGLLGAALGVLAVRFDLIGMAGQAVAAVGAYVAANWQSMVTVTVQAGAALWSMVSDVFTGIAGVASAVWSGVADVVGAAWASVVGSSADGGDQTSAVMDRVGSAVKTFADGVGTVFDVVGYSFTHLGDLFDLEATGMALAVVTLGNQIAYVFTDVIPGYLVWFGNNWQDILYDVANFTGHLFSNITQTIINLFTSIPDLISGNADWSKIWVPLTDGFTATVKELPAIADREKGALEQALEGDYTDLSDKFGQGLGERMAKRTADGAAAAKKITAGIQSTLDAATAPQVKTPEVATPPEVKVAASLDPSNLALTITPEVKLAKITRAGSAESQSLRYLSQAVNHDIGGAVAAAARPPQPPQPAKPVTPGADAFADDTRRDKAYANQDAELLRRQTQVLTDIERNTRGDVQPVVDLA